jgi:hypothetical protein
VVAALVYQSREQLFNVFIWRTRESDGLRVQVRGKATNGLIGEKTSWSSVPFPMQWLLTD